MPDFPGRTVNTVHDLSHVFYPEFHPQARVDFMNMAFGSSLRNTTHVITDTETVRQEFIQHFGWSADKVTAIGLGMDAAYHPRSDAELAPVLAKHGLQPRSYALYVGTIEPRKNIGRLLQAYEQLDPALRKACPLVLAGGKGWKSEDVHRRMEQAANEGWLHYLSYVDQADLPMLYAGARLFAYPSLYEGFGLPIVEAMASGTPVLTSDASCMPEVAGGAAALVNPLDVDDILRGLQSHLGDEVWLRDASAKGLARAATYSWQRCAAETLAVYKAL
ncbi:glycosyltransferase family 4 protein [Comamonas sp. MYb69]|uniref:glycosyltransferase family 4 protein n=1 Tax=Comamonas sp. MYb69 TaxID=1848650 RepID=UPI0030D810E5